MICMLAPSTFLGGDPIQRMSPQEEASSPPSGDEIVSSNMSKELPESPQDDVVNVQLPPTPPTSQGDCDSFTQMEKNLESPLKGYRRVLVKNGSRWTLQFVSPEGIRFDSQDELASHVCRERSDIDPNDLKKLDLHFLKEVDEKENQTLGYNARKSEERSILSQTVPFTFCNMRQNIFDLKRKRGWKRSQSKEFRRNSMVGCSESTENNVKRFSLYEEKENEVTELPESRLREETIPEAPEQNEEKGENDLKLHSDPPENLEKAATASTDSQVQQKSAKIEEHEKISIASSETVQTNDERSKRLEPKGEKVKEEAQFKVKEEEVESFQDKASNVLPITLKEDEEIQIVSCTNLQETVKVEKENLREKMMKECKVSVIDVFCKTPLSSFSCLGCNNKYSGQNDDFSTDLQCQTISIVCGSCHWWTLRRISTETIEGISGT